MNYLNSDLKQKYQKDFEENVMNCKGDWEIPSDLKPLLIAINKRDCLMTLFSKLLIENDNSNLTQESYLWLAYTRESESIIEKYFLDQITKDLCLNNPIEKVSLQKVSGKERKIEHRKNQCQMLFVTDKDYLKLEYFVIRFSSLISYERHLDFWRITSGFLSKY